MTLRVLIRAPMASSAPHLVAALAGSDWASPIACGRRAATDGTTDPIARVQFDATDESTLRLTEAMPPSLLQLWQQDIRLDLTRAEQLLQLQWTALADGLRQAAHCCDQRDQ
jgi:hypothetical protein